MWGAATSAHQVEGDNRNDWAEWEHANSARLAAEAARRPANARPPEFARAKSGEAPTRIPDFILSRYPNPLQEENYISGRAADHYHRFGEDFDIAKRLGHNAHRFSIEWSRIEPEEGKFNQAEIGHYREVIKALRERGMEPFVTLWHYTLPQWFARRGGWLHPAAIQSFVRFVSKMTSEFNPDVHYWITGNEFETFARHGYFLADRPPGQRGLLRTRRVLLRLLEAHKAAYQAIKRIAPMSNAGFTESLVHFEPYRNLPHHLLALKVVKWWRNNPFLAEFVAHSDFIGLQSYFHTRVRLGPKSQWWIQFNENKRISDVGWEIYPESIYHVLKELARYRKPIFITESGLADARDRYRTNYIRECINWAGKALRAGVDVRGYFYWSLLDNFEWNDGFWPRFGLVEVDYKTLERNIRPSAWEYKKIIEANAIELP